MNQFQKPREVESGYPESDFENMNQKGPDTPDYFEIQSVENSISFFSSLHSDFVPNSEADQWNVILKDIDQGILHKAQESPQYKSKIQEVLDRECPLKPVVVERAKEVLNQNFAITPPNVFFSSKDIIRSMQNSAPPSLRYKLTSKEIEPDLRKHIREQREGLSSTELSKQFQWYIGVEEKRLRGTTFDSIEEATEKLFHTDYVPAQVREFAKDPAVQQAITNRFQVSSLNENSPEVKELRLRQAIAAVKQYTKTHKGKREYNMNTFIDNVFSPYKNSQNTSEQKLANAVGDSWVNTELKNFIRSQKPPQKPVSFESVQNKIQDLFFTQKDTILSLNSEQILDIFNRQLEDGKKKRTLAFVLENTHTVITEIETFLHQAKTPHLETIAQSAQLFTTQKNLHTDSFEQLKERFIQSQPPQLQSLAEKHPEVFENILKTYFESAQKKRSEDNIQEKNTKKNEDKNRLEQKKPEEIVPHSDNTKPINIENEIQVSHSKIFDEVTRSTKPTDDAIKEPSLQEEDTLNAKLEVSTEEETPQATETEDIKTPENIAESTQERSEQQEKTEFLSTLNNAQKQFFLDAGLLNHPHFHKLFDRFLRAAKKTYFSESTPFHETWLKTNKTDSTLYRDFTQFFNQNSRRPLASVFPLLFSEWKASGILKGNPVLALPEDPLLPSNTPENTSEDISHAHKNEEPSPLQEDETKAPSENVEEEAPSAEAPQVHNETNEEEKTSKKSPSLSEIEALFTQAEFDIQKLEELLKADPELSHWLNAMQSLHPHFLSAYVSKIRIEKKENEKRKSSETELHTQEETPLEPVFSELLPESEENTSTFEEHAIAEHFPEVEVEVKTWLEENYIPLQELFWQSNNSEEIFENLLKSNDALGEFVLKQEQTQHDFCTSIFNYFNTLNEAHEQKEKDIQKSDTANTIEQDTTPEEAFEEPHIEEIQDIISPYIELPTHEAEDILSLVDEFEENSLLEDTPENEEGFLEKILSFPEFVEWLKNKELEEQEKEELLRTLFIFFIKAKRRQKKKREKEEKEISHNKKSRTLLADIVIRIQEILSVKHIFIFSHILPTDNDTRVEYREDHFENLLSNIKKDLPEHSIVFLKLQKGVQNYTLTLHPVSAKTPLNAFSLGIEENESQYTLKLVPKLVELPW